jgi:pyruvate dehydrogenase E2 component (dihydrolipoamide acetyltransferase)
VSEIVMPRLSDTMEEGTILRWLVPDGESVRRGQELIEIETDKATMTYESDLDGVITIVAAEGDTLPVGAVIARVSSVDPETAPGAAGETLTTGDALSSHTGESATVQRPDAPAPAPQEVEPAGEAAQVLAPEMGDAPAAVDGERVKASPLARRVAREGDIDLNALTGTGPGGRIVKADVQAAADREPAAGTASADTPSAGVSATPSRAASAEGVTTAKGETTELELSRTQQTIARRMAESKATIPHFALQTDVDMQECVALRSQLKGLGQADAPTYNDMIVKAAAIALREYPRANSSYRDGRLQVHSRVNVGVAVALDSDAPTGGALVVPTVFDADVISLGEIARETRALAAKVRDGSITPPELGGGTFTVSNLGMFGIESFTAIVNPPQAAILSVGAVSPRAVVREGGEILARQTMTVTLACDHRILYGADAARLLARIRELLEQPASLTL